MAAVAAAFAGKAVATSAISYIINKAFDHLKDNKKAGGLKSTKARLEKLLPLIQVVFDAVDTEQIRDRSEALDDWLWQLRDAVEEAEDALDELEYYKLEEEVKLRDNKVGGSLHKYKGKLVQQFNDAFNTGSLKRLKSAFKALDAAAAGVEQFFSVLSQLDNNKMIHRQEVDFRNRQTSSLPESLVLGREKEKKDLVEWLTKAQNSEPGQIANNIPIFSIIGVGGLGKTTLAQVICNNDEVKKYFDLIIWVCVSHDFDVETITRKILQDVTKGQVNMVGLNALHKVLMEKLSSKTFLLVLDDVWNDDRVDAWENIVRPLRYGKKGSKILLTTRMQSAADLAARAMQGEYQSLKLGGLEETDLLVLLNMHALYGVNPDDCRNLQQISKKMVYKLSGSPLAAKVLGGLLNSKRDSRTWNRILASSIYNIEHGKEGIMMVLKLSYQHLQTHLQACFRYCSLFHKNYEFTKKELVHLWMGSGLIQHVDGKMPEDVGIEYLDTLTKKSFFDVKSRPLSSRDIKCMFFYEYYEERYVIHDLLHELGRLASVKECVRVDRNISETNLKSARHMYIEVTNPTVIEQISQAKKLRTLVMHFQEEEEAAQELILKKVLAVSKTLRVLSLNTNSLCKLPNELGGMLHLRYLSLVRVGQNITHASWFPQSVYKLYHLQIMKYDDPHLAVPVNGEVDRLCNLVNLRHLHLPYFTMPMIPYVGNMTSLHELYGFFIRQQDGYTIGELKNLKSICHLDVSGLDKVRNTDEAAEVMLDQKENLFAITFNWSPLGPRDVLKVIPVSSDSCDPSKAEQLLDKLQPHPNSCKLKIQGYPGSRSPCWLESPILINLTYLCICDCKRLQRLPPIGQLPSLKYLYILNMESVGRVDSSFYGIEEPYGLQSLKVLEIEDMPICTEWVRSEDENLFPRLDTLVVRNCEELRQLPNIPTSIRHVEIYNAGLQAIPLPPFLVSSGTSSSSSLRPSLSLSKLMISRCPNLATLWQGYSLPALEELSIQQCASLSCLPEDSFRSFSNLKTFEIVRCPNLMAGGIKLPPTVRDFNLGLCGDAETQLMYSLQGLESLQRLILDGCALPFLPSDVFMCLTGLATMVFSECEMKFLPSTEAFARLTNLKSLFIWDCKELASLDGIQGLNLLTSLVITGCSSLVQDSPDQSAESADLSACALELGELDIDHPSILLREPLRSITTVKRLQISGGPKLAVLPEEWLLRNCQVLEEIVVCNASHLRCLPEKMASLTSLRSLKISNANLIQMLPDMPASLSILCMDNCRSELKERCKKNVGPDWGKIAHICDVDIC
ncbi:unnamed protein product [Urochloa humidicola]